MVLITDKFHKASSGTRAEATTLTAQKALAASSISTAALNGWATDTPVDFQLYTTDTQGNIVAGSQSDWTGIVSGTTITQIQLTGGSDDVYPIGTIVVCLPTANWADSLVEGILVEHEQDGTHGDISATSIATDTIAEKTAANGVAIDGLTIKDGKLDTANSVVTANYTGNSVTAPKLATDAITIGYAQITTTITTTSTTSVQATGLTASVTIPSGGRTVEITAFIPRAQHNASTQYMVADIWDGTVGSGTKLVDSAAYNVTVNTGGGIYLSKVITGASAGAKTYNVGFYGTSANTSSITVSATSPAYILVKVL